jgi:hypothetical protein
MESSAGSLRPQTVSVRAIPNGYHPPFRPCGFGQAADDALAWIDEPPFFTPHGAPCFRTITLYEDKVVAWGPDVAAAGFIATIK